MHKVLCTSVGIRVRLCVCVSASEITSTSDAIAGLVRRGASARFPLGRMRSAWQPRLHAFPANESDGSVDAERFSRLSCGTRNRQVQREARHDLLVYRVPVQQPHELQRNAETSLDARRRDDNWCFQRVNALFLVFVESARGTKRGK